MQYTAVRAALSKGQKLFNMYFFFIFILQLFHIENKFSLFNLISWGNVCGEGGIILQCQIYISLGKIN